MNDSKVEGRWKYDPRIWQLGQAGVSNIVTYDGEDIVGVCYLPTQQLAAMIADKHNTVVMKAVTKYRKKLKALTLLIKEKGHAADCVEQNEYRCSCGLNQKIGDALNDEYGYIKLMLEGKDGN